MAAQRIGEAYRIVERYEVPGKDVYLTAYRFRHSGDPVTQAAIVFLGANGDAYLLEVTGHQNDETLLLGEARQIAHSVTVARREGANPLTQLLEYFEVPDATANRVSEMGLNVAEQQVVGGRLIIPADFTASDSMIDCRAAAVFLWTESIRRMIISGAEANFEVRVACPRSSVVAETVFGASSKLTQFDSDGGIVFEKSTPPG